MNNLINKFRNDKLDASELEQLREKTSKLSPEDLEELLQAEWFSNESDIMEPDQDIKDHILENLNNNIRLRRKFKLKVLGWTMAACVCMVLVLATLFVRFKSNLETTPINITTARNENVTVVLPDSSEIKLNQNSDLLYSPTVFKKNHREVQFIGEGYFKIYHDARNPFTIKAGDVLITVKGTEFNLSSQSESSVTSLYLIEGMVEMYSQLTRNKIDVKPGQLVQYNPATGNFVVSTPSANSNIVAWYTKEIHFDNESLPEVLSFLEKHFDVSIEVTILSNELKSRGLKNVYFNGTLPTGNLPVAIRALEEIYPLKLTCLEAAQN